MKVLAITDVLGNTEPLVGVNGLTRTRKVNGEKTLSFTVIPTSINEISFSMVQEESKIELDGETYVIKQVIERSIGKTFIKKCEAVHSFFVDLINSYEYNTHDGSMTFNAALSMIFLETPYRYSIQDSFYAEAFENFGEDNRLSLFQKVLERYGAEFYLNGNQVVLKKRIGNDTDFQFRYSYNIKTLERTIDTKGLSTYIKGYGKDIEAEYTSPNATVFGKLHAKPVRDDRYTNMDSLMSRMKSELQDEPLVSIKVDFVDMRRVGFPYDVPNEGDRVPLIYEPMGINVDTRIMQVEEEFDDNLEIIDSNITLANYNKSLSGTVFQTVQKEMNKIIDDDGIVKNSALNQAIQSATTAINNSMTELEYPQNGGIIARSKKNPNYIVRFTSEGIGVSMDNGRTYKTAMTAEGIVAELIQAGEISGSTLRTSSGSNYVHIEKQFIRLMESNLTRMFLGYYINLSGKLQPTILMHENITTDKFQEGTLVIAQLNQGTYYSANFGISKGESSAGNTYYPSNLRLTSQGNTFLHGDNILNLEGKQGIDLRSDKQLSAYTNTIRLDSKSHIDILTGGNLYTKASGGISQYANNGTFWVEASNGVTFKVSNPSNSFYVEAPQAVFKCQVRTDGVNVAGGSPDSIGTIKYMNGFKGWGYYGHIGSSGWANFTITV